MKISTVHPWRVTPREAVAIQERLRETISTSGKIDWASISLVAGADVSFEKATNKFFAAVVVLETATLQVVEAVATEREAEFPYVPGLLTFREGPVLEDAFRRLHSAPDAILFDGHGMAHPRRMGLACHFGLILERPTVGVGKTVLVGAASDPGPEPGDTSPLVHKGETIGMVLRTKRKVKPVYVSIGHRIELDEACTLVMKCVRGYRLPEPTRLAHIECNRLRTG